MTALDDLAAQVFALQKRLDDLTRPSQLSNSSIEQGGETVNLADAATTAIGVPAALATLQDTLDTNEETLAAVKIDVQAAIDAAQEASDAGVAAGEEGAAAAAEALEKAQQALDAAQAAGGGATYTNRAPTADDPGTPGKQWYVWDSGYHVTGYYVYQDNTTKWVQAVLDDGTFGNLNAGRITSGFLDAARIAANSLTAAVLAADTLTSREIGADAILARNIKAAEITGDKIAARTIAAGNIVASTITGNEIKANSITANQIAANSITANEINLDTLNGKTINGLTIVGATLKSATSGQRVEVVSNQVNFYNEKNALAGYIRGGYSNWGGTDYPLVGVGGGDFGVAIGGGQPIWQGTTVGLRVNGDTAVKRVFLDPASASDGYVCGIYGFAKKSSTDATPVPMPLLYAKGNTGSAYPDMFIENIKSITAENYLLPDGSSLSADTGWVTVSILNGGWIARYPVRFRRIGKVVYVSGQLYYNASGAVPNGTSAFTIPAGFRPAAQSIFLAGVPSWQHQNVAFASGDFQISANVARTSGTGYPLDGMSYTID